MAYNPQQQGYGAFKDQDPNTPYQSGFPQDHPPPPQGGYSQQGGYPSPSFYAPPGEYVQGTGDNSDPENGGGEIMAEVFVFSEKTVRMAFIRKVYSILTVQLAVTTGLIALFVLNEDVKMWARANILFVFLAIGITIVLAIALYCCPDVRRKAPLNFICLAVFTIAEGFLLGFISSFYTVDSVLLAAGITTVLCLALTVFAFQTKVDFTVIGGALFIGLIVLILFGILLMFLPRSQFPILHIVYGCLGAFIFSLYLIHDTQLMMGGNHKLAISPEEYIFAALELYLDIINLFMYILDIVGKHD